MEAMAAVGRATSAPAGQVIEYELAWPGAPKMLMPMMDMATMAADPYACCLPGGGSTHELVYDRNGGTVFWVSGQMYDHIARIALDGSATYFEMPKGSMPHGMAYDQQGRLWVTFEGLGQLARINPDGSVAETLDIAIYAKEVKGAFNPHQKESQSLSGPPAFVLILIQR
jgi:virginiamycin B lyase